MKMKIYEVKFGDGMSGTKIWVKAKNFDSAYKKALKYQELKKNKYLIKDCTIDSIDLQGTIDY